MVVVLVLAFALTVNTDQSVVVYEAGALPESVGWERVGTMDADRWVENGWFWQLPELGAWAPGPLGENDYYRRSVAEFAGEPAFFIEWLVRTDAVASILETYGTPAVLSAGGNGNAIYHFTFTDQRVRVFRGATLPEVYVDIAPNVPHTYRVELFWDASYAWYIDGELIDSGIPNGPYPREDSRIIWGSQYYEQVLPVQTTRWDYVRYGVIQEDASGDYDSDGAVSLTDFYFLHECLTNNRIGIIGGPESNSGPGCRFADFDSDGDTDLLDIAAFQTLFAEE